MVANTGNISTLSIDPAVQIDDATDSIHSAIIMYLNAAAGENRAIDGFTITQGVTSSHTHYVVGAGKVLRNGKLISISSATLTTDASTGTANSSKDWYGVIVVCDGTESGETVNTLKWRHGTTTPTTGKLDTGNATVSAIQGGDIPIAVVKYAAGSADDLSDSTTARPIQFLGYKPVNDSNEITREFSAINDGAETLRINADGTVIYEGTANDHETTLSFTDPTGDRAIVFPDAGGTVALTDSNITGTAAGLSTTLAIASGGTGATNSNTWLNSRITTNADGSLNYDATTATAVNHDNLAGFVANEHIDWSASQSGNTPSSIHADNYTNTTYSVFTGANGSSAGTSGLVTSPTATDNVKFLRGDSTWAVPTNDDVSIANLKSKLNSDFTGDFTIGNQTDDTATFTGHVSVGGDLAVTGDLNITGDINSVNVTDLDVDDITITVASGAADSSAADGAGLIIDGASASFTYSHSGTKFVANKTIEATSFIGNLVGNPSIGTKSDDVAYDLIFEGGGALYQDGTSGNLSYNPSTNNLYSGSLQSQLGITAGASITTGGHLRAATRVLAGNTTSGLIGAYYHNDRKPVVEGYGEFYAESRLLVDNTNVESSASDDIKYYGTGAAYVIETQRDQHKSGFVWTHDDDDNTTNTDDDFTWGIGKQFNTNGTGTSNLQIGYVDDKTYDGAFLTNDADFVFRSDNAVLTIDTSKNVSLTNGITLGTSSLTTAGTLRYNSNNIQFYNGSAWTTLDSSGGEANQNAFSNVVIGSDIIAADSATDSLNLTAGSNITLAANTSTDTVTITGTNTNLINTDLVGDYGQNLTYESGITAGAAGGNSATSDYLIFRDNTDNAMKKITLTDLMGAVGHGLIPALPPDKIDYDINDTTFPVNAIPELAQSKITSLTTDLAAKVPNTTTINGISITNDFVFEVDATTGKLLVTRTGASDVAIQNNAGTPADVVIDNGLITLSSSGGTVTINNASSSSNTITKTDLALGNVTNESKATMFASPTFTGTVSGVTKSHVGLGSVDNKSSATLQSEILSAASKTDVGLGNVVNERQITVFKQTSIPTATAEGDLWYDTDDDNRLYRATAAGDNQVGSGEWIDISPNKDLIGLSNVPNTDATDVDNHTDGTTNKVYSSTEKTKLSGVAANATVGAIAGTNLKDSSNNTLGDEDVKNDSLDIDTSSTTLRIKKGSTVINSTTLSNASVGLNNVANVDTRDADNHTDGTTNKVFSGTNKTKLGGIESGATTGKLFFQASVPTAKTVGDLWFDSDDSNRMYIAASATADEITSGEWESIGFPAGEANANSITYNVSAVDGSNTDEEQIRLTGSDGSTDHVVLEAGTGLSIARSGDKITFTNTVTDTDTNNYADSLAFDTSDGTLTVGRSGSLADLTVDLDGRYALTAQSGEANQNAFSNIAISGQTTIEADSTTDTLNVAAGANISLTTNATSDTLTIASTQLTSEEVQDIVGAMFSGNTETRISATYQDGDGTIDLVVDDMTADTNTFRTVIAGGNTLGTTETLTFAEGSNVTISESGGTVTIASTDTNTTYSVGDGGLTQNNFTNTLKTKLDGIETSADVTDAANVRTALNNAMASNTLTVGDSNTTTTFPGSIVVTGTTTTNNVETVSTSNGVVFEGSAADANELTLLAGTLSGDRTITLPDATGTVLLTDGSGASLTALNASEITSGTIAAARVATLNQNTTGSAATLTTARNFSLTGDVTASAVSFDGSGAVALSTSLASNSVDSAELVDGSIDESHLNATNSPTDNYLLSYDSASSGFTWVDAASAGSSNQTITTGSGIDGANSGSTSNITIALDIDGLTDINAALVDADIFAVDDGANGTNRKATMSRLKTYMQNNLTFTTDTNTNQLTTFNIGVDTNSNSTTIAHGETLTFTGGTGISTETTADGTVTITSTVTDTNTQLSNSQVETAYNTQVSQVSSTERTNGTETGIRRYAPADIKSMIDTHQTDTDTNTNQLTTFTLAGDSGTSQTIAHGNTLTVTGGNAITTAASDTDTITINHADTSSQASVNNSGRTYIQDITLDTYGHITAITSATETVTNTDVDVNVSNLTARLPQITESLTIGDATDVTITTSGNLTVTGDLEATTKSFVIPHPTKKDMTLHHGSLEGPEHGVYYRGRLIEENVIELPEYWVGLVDDTTITVQLTPNGSFQMLYVEKIEDNKVYVINEADEGINCFYIIHGERKDVGKMEVEY